MGFNGIQQQQLLICTPTLLEYWCLHPIHNTIVVDVLVWCNLNAKGETLDTEIEVLALGTLYSDHICDVFSAVITVVLATSGFICTLLLQLSFFRCRLHGIRHLPMAVATLSKYKA